MPIESDTIDIGALARATGLTARALRHYDAIGLLAPSQREQSGRRLYSRAEVARLYRILALRRLGLPLEEIAALLDDDADLVATVRRHVQRVERQLELERRLLGSLRGMLARLERRQPPALDELIETIEVMTMTEQYERYYTPQQLEQLRERRDRLGPEAIARGEQEWATLIEEVRAEREAGTEPTDPRMLALGRRWRALIEQFTGGDEGIRSSLATMYREQGPEQASRGMVDGELMAYVSRALDALRDG